jgi:transmembrane sensor
MKELFRKYLENRCSPDEVKLLLKEFDLDDNEFSLRALIQQHFETDSADIKDRDEKIRYLIDESYSIVKSKIDFKENRHGKKIIPFTAYAWFQYVAAAVFIIFLGTGTYYFFSKNDPAKHFVQEKTTPIKEILPGGNRAVLTLENGGQIILDTASKGMITRQTGAQVIKSDEGKIEYVADNKISDKTDYNTISTPVGGQYQLTLSDGTQVWLNAASSVRFPATFNGKERKIFITGEVYFEVRPQYSQVSDRKGRQKNLPFIVDVAGKGSVEVLGTHFNINSYSDEETIKTTLLEGSIKFTPNVNPATSNPNVKGALQKSVQISPGQQAQLNSDGQVLINSDVNLEKVVAWKNGYFLFSSSSLKDVMSQIARWYGVEVVFEGKPDNRKFGGKIQRDLILSKALKILEKNDIKFKIEGKTIYVGS